MFQGNNPTLREDVFRQAVSAPSWAELDATAKRANTMTIQGTAIKTLVLLAISAITGVLAFNYLWSAVIAGTRGLPANTFPIMLGAMLGGLALALVMSFKPMTARFLAVPYAALQGAFIGALSLFIPLQFLGGRPNFDPNVIGTLVFQAAGLTFAIAFALGAIYSTGLVRIGGTAMKFLFAAVAGVALYAVAIMVCNGLLGMNIPNLWASASPLGIGFSALMVGLASFTLLATYQQVDDLSKGGVPKQMEWYGAFAILVELLWLYIEVLRLLAKLKSRE